jgi:hypothetical protein
LPRPPHPGCRFTPARPRRPGKTSFFTLPTRRHPETTVVSPRRGGGNLAKALLSPARDGGDPKRLSFCPPDTAASWQNLFFHLADTAGGPQKLFFYPPDAAAGQNDSRFAKKLPPSCWKCLVSCQLHHLPPLNHQPSTINS